MIERFELLNSSTPQLLNSSTPQLLNSSTPQLLNSSTPQLLNSSTHLVMLLRVIPLGTSAGRPTLLRGASALAVAAERGWVLCDCGEGAQLSAQRADLSLSRLQAVLITHLHGDHFNGLPGLLGTLGLEGRERPLLVAGPRGILALLETLQRYGSLGVA